jgi:hypothetical protein
MHLIGRSTLYSPYADVFPPNGGRGACLHSVNGGKVMSIIVINIGMKCAGIPAATSAPASEAKSGLPPHLASASFAPIIVVLLGWLMTVTMTMTEEGMVVAAFTQFNLGVPHQSSKVCSQPRSLYVPRRSMRSMSTRMAGATHAIAWREADLKYGEGKGSGALSR